MVWLFAGRRGQIPAVLGKAHSPPGCRWFKLGSSWLLSLMAGVALRLLVMPVFGTQALLHCQSLLPTLAGSSSLFGCILVFPVLLLLPLWGEVSTCGEVECTAWGASSLNTILGV